jgi:hypothetical protein
LKIKNRLEVPDTVSFPEEEDRQASEVIDDILRLTASSQPHGPAQTQARDTGVAHG